MAPVLGFLLLLGLCGDTVSEGPLTSTDRSVGLKFEFPLVKYETEESYEAGPINILFQIAHVFLHLVQPNPFPEGKCPLRAKLRFVSRPTRMGAPTALFTTMRSAWNVIVF